jgi:tetratricopeptide (TPR) repeat protein
MKKTVLFATAIFSLLSMVSFAQTKEEAIRKTLNERYESAESDLNTLLGKDANNGDNYAAAGDNYLYWGELDNAQKMFQKGTEVAPLNPLNFAGLGRLAWVNGDAATATARFNEAVAIMTNKKNKVDKATQQTAYLKMAEAYLSTEKKNLDGAIGYINAAKDINDKNPELYIQLGDYYRERDGIDLSNALGQYNKALEMDPKYTRALLRKGVLYVNVKNYDQGLSHYNEAIEQDPNFAPAYREKAELLYKAGRYKQAIDSYAKYLELNQNCRVQQRYATFVYLTKEYQTAITELEKALPCDPSNLYMYRLLGYAYTEVGDLAKGHENLDKFMTLAAEKGAPEILGNDYAYKGKLYQKAGQDSLAIEMLNIALEKDPTYVEGYGELASIYGKQKKYDLAADFYQKKIEKSDKPAELDYYYLGQYRYFNKQYAEADAAFANALSYPDANFWRGRSQNRLEVNPEEPVGLARPYHEAFIKGVGDDPARIEPLKRYLVESYSYLGLLHGKQGNFDCSKAAWLKALELDPTNKVANDVMNADKNLQAASEANCVLIAE